EVEAADVIVIGAPMYNYGMPAALKAWFDQIVRIDRTFTFDLARGDQPLEPMLSGKQVVVLASWGEFGFEPGGQNAAHNHLVPHIRTCSRYLGAESFDFLAIEYQEFGDERHEASKREAFNEIPALLARLQGVRAAAA
ncbi:MAG: NAD(P)H-dependent oxidoreductase, partial [Gammaproteobacteria bacterium]